MYYALNNEHMYATRVPLLQLNSPGFSFLFGSAVTHIFLNESRVYNFQKMFVEVYLLGENWNLSNWQ